MNQVNIRKRPSSPYSYLSRNNNPHQFQHQQQGSTGSVPLLECRNHNDILDAIRMPPPPPVVLNNTRINHNHLHGSSSSINSFSCPPPALKRPRSIVDSSTKSGNRTTFIDLLDDDDNNNNYASSATSDVHHNVEDFGRGFVIDRQPQPQASNNTTFALQNRTSLSASASRTSTNFATSAITLLETNHGRERRVQRAIPTREIQAAMKYGEKINHPSDRKLVIYRYNGKEHIIDRDRAALVTTMVKTIDLRKKIISDREQKEHQDAYASIHQMDNDVHSSSSTQKQQQPSNRKIEKKHFGPDHRTADILSGEHNENHVNSIFTSTNSSTTSSTNRLKSIAEEDEDSDEEEEEEEEEDVKIHIKDDERNLRQQWKSHSVIIVDKSGSMRNSDVNGSRTRFGAVWLSLAQDYIEQRLNAGTAGPYDVVSIILMGNNAELLLDRWPTTNVLYNKIVDLFEQSEEADKLWKQINPQQKKSYKSRKGRESDQRKLDRLVKPQGHGCYSPSLLLAEKLLEKNDNDSCALSLLLLSDGKPSDHFVYKQGNIKTLNILKDATGRMASKFGRRFNFSTIGMGSFQEFRTLEHLVDSARDFGGNASFSVPSMSSAAIGRAISSVATSLTTTQTELMSCSRGKAQRRVRPCIRENRKLIPLWTEVVSSDEFDIYMNDKVEHYE